MAVEKMRQI